MKLRIVDFNGSSEEIVLKKQEPSFDFINKELLLFENFSYKIIIYDNEMANNIDLLIGDYSTPLDYNEINGSYETKQGLIFNDCFDLVYLSVYIEDHQGTEHILYTDFLRIATTKQKAIQVEHMLEEIEENLPNYLDVCFSRNRKASGLIKNSVRSIWNTLKLVDEIINVYEESYSYFSNHRKESVEPISAVVDVKEMRSIEQEGLRWITCNPDVFVQTPQKSIITIVDKYYMPQKVKTTLSQYSYDVYENQIILGFLKTIFNYVEEQIKNMSKEVDELKNIPNEIVMKLPNTHELTGYCIYVYYKGVIDRFLIRKEVLQGLYYKYEKGLRCSAKIVYTIPKSSNTFRRVYRYRLCYECIVKWFETGDYDFSHLNYLFKLKALSRVFEYFCLIKLQTAISQCGFSIKETDRLIYDQENEIEDINNYYLFEGNGYKITLFYEPYIKSDGTSNHMNLYSTGYNFDKKKWNDVWKPDFVIKISSTDSDYYYILDAKYSSEKNVKNRYISKLVLKYGTQIASKDKFFSDVIGIGAIYPDDINKIQYYRKNDVRSVREALPKYFSLSIMLGDEGNNVLASRILELLEVVNAIENDNKRRNRNSIQKKIKNENDLTDAKSDENKVKQLENKKQITSEAFKNSKPNIKAIGKKCFYFAKGQCLLQKTICRVTNMECNLFVHQNDKNLIIEKCDCRHLENKHRRRNSGAECKISGRKGCIGMDNCKWYIQIKRL